jgi:hypothetical protein
MEMERPFERDTELIKPSKILETTKLLPVTDHHKWTEQTPEGIRYCAVATIAQELFPNGYVRGFVFYVKEEIGGEYLYDVLHKSGAIVTDDDEAATGSDSLKITIPHAIAEVMKLAIGDTVVWELDKVGDQVFVTVRKEAKKESS